MRSASSASSVQPPRFEFAVERGQCFSVPPLFADILHGDDVVYAICEFEGARVDGTTQFMVASVEHAHVLRGRDFSFDQPAQGGGDPPASQTRQGLSGFCPGAKPGLLELAFPGLVGVDQQKI